MSSLGPYCNTQRNSRNSTRPFPQPRRRRIYYIRRARGDELWLISRFERHLRRCTTCYTEHFDSPWHRPDSNSLCSRGTMHAYNLVDYLYSSKGHVYSHFDKPTERLEVDFLPGWSASRSLLVAVEYGMRVKF